MLIRNAQDLGKLIRATRKANNITQKDVAAACGIGIHFVRELEKGKPTCELDKALLVVTMHGIKLEVNSPAVMKESNRPGRKTKF